MTTPPGDFRGGEGDGDDRARPILLCMYLKVVRYGSTEGRTEHDAFHSRRVPRGGGDRVRRGAWAAALALSHACSRMAHAGGMIRILRNYEFFSF